MNYEAPRQENENPIDVPDVDKGRVTIDQIKMAEKLGSIEDLAGSTVLMRRSERSGGGVQEAYLTGKKVVDEDGEAHYEVAFNSEDKQEAFKWVKGSKLTPEVQERRAAELQEARSGAGSAALQGAGVEVAASSEAQEAAPEAVAPADDIEAYLKRAQENRLAAEARGETPFAEVTSESANEASEYVPGEFAGKLYKFKQDYTQAAQEVAEGANTSLVALENFGTLLDKGSLKGSNKQAFIDQLEAIKSEAGKGVQDANSLAQDATELLQKQDDGDSGRTERLHELASDLSNKLRSSGSEAAGYAQRLLDTLDALRNEDGSENIGRVQEELSSDIGRLRVALSSSHEDWGLVENRLEDLTQ